MKADDPITTKASRYARNLTLASLVTMALCHAADAATISGVGELSTTSTGSYNGDSRWNTVGGDSIVTLFVARGSTLDSPFINGPTDSQAAVSIPLALGTHDFMLFAPGGLFNSTHGLNLFFNGNNLTPRISVYAPNQTSQNPPYPPFLPNGGTTQALNGQTTPAANSLSFLDGSTLVTLTAYSWASPSVYNIDRVGVPPGGFAFVGSDGAPDWVGRFTLDVTAVPEPSTWLFLSMGALGIALLGRRISNSSTSQG